LSWSALQVAHCGLAGVFSCGTALMSVWQSTQANMLPWIEALNFAGSTDRLTGLPSTSLVRPPSGAWQAMHSVSSIFFVFLSAAQVGEAADIRAMRIATANKKCRLLDHLTRTAFVAIITDPLRVTGTRTASRR